MIEVASDFFNGATLFRFSKATFIVLIPKVDNPSSLEKFRPISLYSMAYKIFSKVIVGRLS